MHKNFVLRFRLRTLIVVMCLVSAVFGGPHIWRTIQFRRMMTYSEQDLRKMPQTEYMEFERIACDVLGDKSPSFWESWYLWDVRNVYGGASVLVFQTARVVTVPGTSSVRLTLLDPRARILSQTTLSTGWRVHVVDAAWEAEGGHGFPYIEVSTGSDMLGPDIARQYYAFIHGKYSVIRLENRRGEAVVNKSCYRHLAIGEPPSKWPIAELERTLKARNGAELLEALFWLGSVTALQSSRDDDSQQVSFVDAVRSRRGLKVALQSLAQDRDEWVKTAAQIALDGLAGVSDQTGDDGFAQEQSY